MAKKTKRKTKYESLVEPRLAEISDWVAQGVEEINIAKNLGISYSRFKDYKNIYLALSAAIKNARSISDITVQGALYKSSIGFTVSLKRPFKVKNTEYNDKGFKIKETEEIIYADYEEFVRPEVSAQIYWLNNRWSEKWSNKHAFYDNDNSFEENRQTFAALVAKNQTVDKNDKL